MMEIRCTQCDRLHKPSDFPSDSVLRCACGNTVSLSSNRPQTAWKKVYLFVSSTFNDMHAERDYLIKRVFPKLQDWCEQHKLRLFDIDLRWGVTEEDSRSKRTVQVCLDRVDLCRPFFLCFLGQRYGWTPCVTDLAPDTFHNFPGLREAVEARTSVTEMEIRHAALAPFHSPEHIRNMGYAPTKHALFYLRDPEYLADIPQDPPQLRPIFVDDEFAERMRRLREEIIPSTKKPIQPYWCHWEETERTPELTVPLQCPMILEQHQQDWRRRWQQVGVQVQGLDVAEDPKEAEKANAFNEKFTTGRLTGFFCPSKEQVLADVVLDDLKAAISAEYPEHTDVVQDSVLQQELDQYEEFLFACSEGFIERGDDFAELDAYIAGDSRKLFALVAEAGTGKSTLLANWIDRYRKRIHRNTGESIHFRFIGVGERSHTVDALLFHLSWELKDVAGKLKKEIPLDPNELRREWPKFLEECGQKGKTVLVLDAINQLDSGLSDLQWLLYDLPPNIKIIVSFKLGGTQEDALHQRFAQDDRVFVSRLRAFESLEDRRKLVKAFLSHYLKDMDEHLLEALIQLQGSHNPLYLKVVLLELRVFGSFSGLAEKIRRSFGDTPQSAFDAVLARLETDPAHIALEPKVAVPLLFGLLAHARHGLSVEELAAIFLRELRYEEYQRDGVTDAIQLLLRQVRPFLARRSGRYDFFYESFLLAAHKRYQGNNGMLRAEQRPEQAWHGLLADYFANQPTLLLEPEDKDTSQKTQERKSHKRKASELVYHLIYAQRWTEVVQNLGDLSFIEAKCQASLLQELMDDYILAKQKGPKPPSWSGNSTLAAWERFTHQDHPWPERTILEEWERFVRTESHILRHHPMITFQQAANWPTSSIPCKATQVYEAQQFAPRSWLKWVNKPQQLSPCLMNIFGHLAGIQSCVWSPDGSRLLSASDDHTLKLWDANTSAELLTLFGHRDAVTACHWATSGTHVLSLSRDNSMKLWSPWQGVLLHTFSHFPGTLTACCFSPDGQFILSSSCDDNAVVFQEWDLHGNLLHSFSVSDTKARSFSLHRIATQDCCYSPDSHYIIATFSCYRGTEYHGFYENTHSLRIFDRKTGTDVRACNEHFQELTACCVSPTRGMLASACSDHTLTLTEFPSRILQDIPLSSGNQLEGHTDAVLACCFSPDGRWLVSASKDNTLKLWDVPSRVGTLITTWHGHTQEVTSCCFSPDGTKVLSSSLDGTLRIWDTSMVYSSATNASIHPGVTACCFSSDGIQLATVSNQQTSSVKDIGDVQMMSNTNESTLCLWEAHTGKQLRSFPFRKGGGLSCQFTPHGQHLLVQTKNMEDRFGSSQWWDVTTGTPFHELHHHRKEMGHQFSPDGTTLACIREDRLCLLDARTCQPIREFEHPEPPTRCCFSPNHRFLLSTHDSEFVLWDVQTGQCLATLPGQGGRISTCCFSPDGREILAASQDHGLRRYDAQHGQLLAAMTGHTGTVLSCFYLPDALHAVSIACDGTLRLWNLALCREVGRLVGEFVALAVSPSTHSFAACEKSGTLHLLEPMGIKKGDIVPKSLLPLVLPHSPPPTSSSKVPSTLLEPQSFFTEHVDKSASTEPTPLSVSSVYPPVTFREIRPWAFAFPLLIFTNPISLALFGGLGIFGLICRFFFQATWAFQPFFWTLGLFVVWIGWNFLRRCGLLWDYFWIIVLFARGPASKQLALRCLRESGSSNTVILLRLYLGSSYVEKDAFFHEVEDVLHELEQTHERER